MAETTKPKTRRDAFRAARLLRERFRKEGEFSQADFRSALYRELKGYKSFAYDAYVDHVAEHVDRDATRDIDASPMFPGWDLDGEYRLGNGRRIAKTLATIDHADAAMALDDANLTVVMQANTRKREELTRLRPYWSRPGFTKPQAIAAYSAANPDSQAGA